MDWTTIGAGRLARVLVSTLVLGLAGAAVQAQGNRPPPTGSADPVTRPAPAALGEIRGIVTDAGGTPLGGAMISALGAARVAFAVCDAEGRFELRSLPSGPYLLRAHLKGFTASPSGLVEVGPNRPTVHFFMLRQSFDTVPVAEAAVPSTLAADFFSSSTDQPGLKDVESIGESTETTPTSPLHDHSEKAWRLRHLRRSVLKEVVTGVEILNAGVTDEAPFLPGTVSWLGRAAASSAHLAGMLDDLPFSGQFGLLTTSTLAQSAERPSGAAGGGVAYLAIGAPVGSGDWSVRSAITNGDTSSWLLAGSYTADARATHALDAGMSYGVQRYEDGGHSAALGTFEAAHRKVRSVHAFDNWSLSSKLTVDYGTRYARYGDVEGRALFSPRMGVTVSPADRTHIRAAVSQRMVAPGTEQFLPQPTDGLWLQPERAFAPLSPDAPLRSERARHFELGVERELAGAYVVGVRRFYQGVADQHVTVFAVNVPNSMRSDLGGYYVASAGSVDVDGWSVTLSRNPPGRFRGWVDYSFTKARWSPAPETTRVADWAESALRAEAEEFHDVTTSIETEIPETATRVVVLCRMNTAYARPEVDGGGPGLDARFDVQVKQALPFLSFDGSSWEALIAVRSLFREPWGDASAYDELLVVRPPRRIVGGLLVRF